MMANLSHLSEGKLEQLRSDVQANLDRYCGDGFAGFERDPGWSLALDVPVDADLLSQLDGAIRSAEADLKNTKLVASALPELSPSLANEERIWARLSHVEAFEYSRDRWIDSSASEEEVIKAIHTHFFARTQTGLRDDHALSRLWWNSYIARHCYPQDVDRGLELLLTSADVRSNLVERVWLIGRRKLASGVFRAMERDAFVLSSEKSFREFMKALNLLGAGIVFEAMPDSDIDAFMIWCSAHAEQAAKGS